MRLEAEAGRATPRRAAARYAGGPRQPQLGQRTHRHGLAPQDDKIICALHEEPSKLVRQDPIHLVELLDLDAEAHLCTAARA